MVGNSTGGVRTRATWREWSAVVLLAADYLITQLFLGGGTWWFRVVVTLRVVQLVAVTVLIMTSHVWALRDRVVGVLALPLTMLLPAVWLAVAPSDPGTAAFTVIAGLPLACAVYLGYRLRPVN
jgi:hypothetical protein